MDVDSKVTAITIVHDGDHIRTVSTHDHDPSTPSNMLPIVDNELLKASLLDLPNKGDTKPDRYSALIL